MDRQIVYPGAVPLETDLLNTNLNVLIAIGRFVQDILGTGTLAAGLACTQTSVPSMSVAIGAGSLYSQQFVDATPYSSIPGNTTDQIMKQGILLASANKTLAMTAPVGVGTAIAYLVQAAYADVDANGVVLPYYNSSNPLVPYSGPGGTGAAQFTARRGAINITAKAGTAATIGTQTPPSADAGFVPLYYVTIAYGATTIVNANIAVAAGAPFIPNTLTGFAPIASPPFTGTPTAPTPASTDNSTKIATTAFVVALLGSLGGVTSLTTSQTISTALNGWLIQTPTSGITLTFPSASANVNKSFTIFNPSGGTITLAAGNFNSAIGVGVASITVPAGAAGTFSSDGTSWNAFSGSLASGAPTKPQSASGIGQWTVPTIGSGTIVLPAGGTWAYFYSNNGSGGAGIAAGGATVLTATLNNAFGFCWRIA